MNKAVFFDRDGVLNELVNRAGGYFSPRLSSNFRIILNSIEVTNYTKSKGYLNIVISNQPDVARGYLTEFELDKMTNILIKKLLIDDVFYCLHDDDMCKCRKPLPGLIIFAKDKWDIDLNKSIMIGDTEKDCFAAKNSKVEFYLLDKFWYLIFLILLYNELLPWYLEHYHQLNYRVLEQ